MRYVQVPTMAWGRVSCCNSQSTNPATSLVPDWAICDLFLIWRRHKQWSQSKNSNKVRKYHHSSQQGSHHLTQPEVRSREKGPACLPVLVCTEDVGSWIRGNCTYGHEWDICVEWFLALFWQGNCEQSARPSMLIRVPSQIAVDCKSVYFLRRGSN